MQLKWKILTFIVLLYTIGTVGIGLHTRDAAVAAGLPSASIEVIKVVFMALGGLGVILPTYLNVWQSMEATTLLKEQIRYNKIENTLRLMDKWDEKQFFEARRFTRELKDEEAQLSPDQIRERIQTSQELKQSVILLFNFFECVRMSMVTERVEVTLLAQTFGSVYRDMYHRFAPWIKEQPARYQDDLRALEQLFMRHSDA